MKQQAASDTLALLGLGSNLGDREATLRSAIDALGSTDGIEVLAVSAFIVTDPVGRTDQPSFLNAAVKLRTVLSARELLQACLDIEGRHGRQRNERWGPRTLDIDLLLFGDCTINEPGLRVPHPRMHERLFVLAPAAEIGPDMRHPVLKRDVASMLLTLQGALQSPAAHA
jgi:2-amino-4-hydroxy-6-hydroxymethyldihydropteridine diphosphokinase